eukprot:TRINITY_DN14313_c0_g1_i3.p1 TRINITY_DN14313_c0_g1~~TRINITY_DN14313_c0_g1_i3.p1  ORF type:complete len:486 (-),score=82.52 TRINITY_DN14313_c0_g1_i3:318-1775(-)
MVCSDRRGSFLSYVDLQLLPLTWAPIELSPILALLKDKDYQQAFDLVTSGEIAIKAPLSGGDGSLLQLAMHRSRHQIPVAEDVAVLLDAMVLRGERLDSTDFEAACFTGLPGVVKLFLGHGAPLSDDALHVLAERSGVWPAAETIETAKCLLEANASLDGLGSRGETPLAVVCGGIGRHVTSVMEWFLKKGADPCGAGSRTPPLHKLLAKFGDSSQIRLVVQLRADVNQQDSTTGNTPLHCALETRMKYKDAVLLKSLGAAPSTANHEGVTPSQLLLDRNLPERAAELEGRPMNERELKVKAALEHPVAKLFESSIFQSISWVLRSPPDHLSMIKNNVLVEGSPEADRKLSDLLEGCSPKVVVISLPLTRYSELHEDVSFTAPEPEGFTVRSLLMEIYKFYQAPFNATQSRRIERLFRAGKLGDTFGYIRRSMFQDSADGGEQERKARAVPRIELRGDSVFFEGFRTCKYFENERKLCGSLSLGS